MNKYNRNRYGKTVFSISGLIKLPVVLMRMKQLRIYLIQRFKLILPAAWMNQIRNQYLYWRYSDTNRRFAANYPDKVLPPLAFLAETFKPDYAAYFQEGNATVDELMRLLKPNMSNNASNALDWGCGIGRLTTHLQKTLPALHWYACDVRADMIQWNQRHLPQINFAVSDQEPPLPFHHIKFDLIIGFSVFTHIPAALQEDWLKALSEKLTDTGIVLFTTHGSAYAHHLSAKQQAALAEVGYWDNLIGKAGSRSRATYHHAPKFQSIIEQYVEVLAWYDGIQYPSLIGGQDIWICKKKVPQLRD